MEESTAVLWAYFAGAILRLIEKMRKFVYFERKGGSTARLIDLLREWAFEKSLENGASWVATIAAVWIGGFLYVNKIPSFLGVDMPKLMVAAPVAFMLGCLMEQIAPNIIKLFTSKLPFTKK